ncbi:TPA: polysaccharide biosynthesis protein, partial [Streptococcus suis]
TMIYLFYRRVDYVLDIDKKVVIKDIVTISWISVIMGIVVLLSELILNLFIPVTGYVSSFIHLLISGGLGIVIFVFLTLITRQIDRLIGSRAQKLRKRLKLMIE